LWCTQPWCPSRKSHEQRLCCLQPAECLYAVEDTLMRVLIDRYRDELGLSYADDGSRDQHYLGCKLWSVSELSSFGFPKASHTSFHSHLALPSGSSPPLTSSSKRYSDANIGISPSTFVYFSDRLHVFCMSGTLSTCSPRIQRSQRRTLPDLTSPMVWINLSQIVSEMRELLDDSPGWASMGGQ